MKRLFSILLILSLLLCSCRTAEKPDIPTADDTEVLPPPPSEVLLPVLMYHHLKEGECKPNDYTVSAKSFDMQMAALKDAGYSAITPTELYEYLKGDAKSFPEKPILVTFDDGYMSNLEIAVPILKKHGMCATIFVVGNTVGKKDGGITPRFSFEDAKPHTESGVINIGSHTHALHDVKSDRRGVQMMDGEDIYEYKRMLIADVVQARTDIQKGVGCDIIALSYPFGVYNDISASVFEAQKVPLQFTSDVGINKIKFASLDGHRLFDRISIGDEVTGEQLIKIITEAE